MSVMQSDMFLWQGLDVHEGGLDLISNIIRKTLKIDCAVLMGANIASDVAQEQFCEATIGTHTIHFYVHLYLLTLVSQISLILYC